jgi:hypothetical protein
MDQQQQKRVEQLGPAERIIASLTTFSDHLVHNRPGILTKDAHSPIGVKWEPVIWKEEEGKKVIYKSVKVGKRTNRVRIGVMNGDTTVKEGRTTIGEYRKPGLFPETTVHYYRQVAEVFKLDNEFAAHWASWSFPREHRDLKVVLCAFMLVQNRKGAPIIENGEILFRDEDYRNVGEAMCLTRAKTDMNPKLLLRVGDVLGLKGVADINRELGFGNSARNPALGRYYKVVEKWLRYREENPKMIEGLVKAGFRTTVMRLARRVGYKPTTDKFFELLRWKQVQSKDGRRELAIGKKVKKAETWEGKTEKEICELITDKKPGWKRIVGLLPKEVGMTRAIVAAAVEAGCLSEQDLIIITPTLEELGLLKVPEVEKRWKAALEKAENQRAANIARNVKTKEAKEGLQEAVDKATEKALTEVTKDMRVYVVIDKSGSMEGALARAQDYLTKFLGGFPLDRLHVSVFNTIGTELNIRAPKAAAVRQAFAGHRAGGGTAYAQGVQVLAKHKPKENEDAIIIFVGDELDNTPNALAPAVQASGINPVAFGLLSVTSAQYGRGNTVTGAAAQLGIPCFNVDEKMFTSDDPYAITRMLRDLMAATPVGQRTGPAVAKRKSLVEEVLETPLLTKPVWA